MGRSETDIADDEISRRKAAEGELHRGWDPETDAARGALHKPGQHARQPPRVQNIAGSAPPTLPPR